MSKAKSASISMYAPSVSFAMYCGFTSFAQLTAAMKRPLHPHSRVLLPQCALPCARCEQTVEGRGESEQDAGKVEGWGQRDGKSWVKTARRTLPRLSWAPLGRAKEALESSVQLHTAFLGNRNSSEATETCPMDPSKVPHFPVLVSCIWSFLRRLQWA